MKCELCGSDTKINYGNSKAKLCKNCSEIGSGYSFLTKERDSIKNESVHHSSGMEDVINLDNTNQVNIVDIKMPFNLMVVFMVKVTLAAIPALIILTIIGFIISILFAGTFGSMRY